MTRIKPRIFVASSTEGLDVAYSVQESLANDAEVTVWPQGVFDLSGYVLDDLLKELEASDFGVFVFSFEDVTQIRKEQARTARDNVVFELGLYMGRLGRQRCFIVMPRGVKDIHLPTDLLGLKPAVYSRSRDDEKLNAAVGPACNQIRRAIKRQGARGREGGAVKPTARTPDNAFIKSLVDSTLETVCRAFSIPQTPESASLRVFIFRKVKNELVCSHHWAPNPVRETVGRLRFHLIAQEAKKVAVVRAAVNQETTREQIEIRAQRSLAKAKDVTEDLSMVLATPILVNGSLWGVVDFDSSNERGKELLKTEVANSAIFRLAQHLGLLFSLHSHPGSVSRRPDSETGSPANSRLEPTPHHRRNPTSRGSSARR